MTRLDIINYLIEKYGYTSYLEIGVQNPAKNFDLVKCDYKVGVDPYPEAMATYTGTSDDFFEHNQEHFDIIFIDGLHTAEQVEKDANNALRILNDNGVIVWHDCNPISYEMQAVPRIARMWTGDVWKAWVKFRSREDLSMLVINDDFGIGVMRKGKQQPLAIDNPTYDGLENNRKEWLNLKEPNYDYL